MGPYTTSLQTPFTQRKPDEAPGLEDKAGPVPMKSTAVLNTVSFLQQMWAANVGWKHHFIRGASGDYIHMKARLLITHTHALMLGGTSDTRGTSQTWLIDTFLSTGLSYRGGRCCSSQMPCPPHSLHRDYSINTAQGRSWPFQKRRVWQFSSTVVFPELSLRQAIRVLSWHGPWHTILQPHRINGPNATQKQYLGVGPVPHKALKYRLCLKLNVGNVLCL